jgi:hypothetical protein
MKKFCFPLTLVLNFTLSIFFAGQITQNASAETKPPKTSPAKASAATTPPTDGKCESFVGR